MNGLNPYDIIKVFMFQRMINLNLYNKYKYLINDLIFSKILYYDSFRFCNLYSANKLI